MYSGSGNQNPKTPKPQNPIIWFQSGFKVYNFDKNDIWVFVMVNKQVA